MKSVQRRTKNAILNQLKKLESKYGIVDVRRTINSYYAVVREQVKTAKLIEEREKELEKLRKKL